MSISAASLSHSARHAALGNAIDYAGLFPPAELSLAEAVANYRGYRASADAWALGRFVIPVARLSELEALLTGEPRDAPSLPLAALLGQDVAEDLRVIEGFNRRMSQRGAHIESVEARAQSESDVPAILEALPGNWQRYIELPLREGAARALDTVAKHRAAAKVRTGGIALGSFPTPDELLGFLVHTARRGVGFKATAGLHHPLRGSYRLTYDAAAPRGIMYGFLNLLLATAVLRLGASVAEAGAALLENQASTISFANGELRWRKRRFSAADLADLRHGFFHGFGSCSFREPLDELAAGGW